jgi:hypothetical protein
MKKVSNTQNEVALSLRPSNDHRKLLGVKTNNENKKIEIV